MILKAGKLKPQVEISNSANVMLLASPDDNSAALLSSINTLPVQELLLPQEEMPPLAILQWS